MTNGNDHHSENSKNGCCLRVTWLWWYMQSNLVAPWTQKERERERDCVLAHWHPASTRKYTTQISTNDYFPRDSTTKGRRRRTKKELKTNDKKNTHQFVRHGRIKWNEHNVCEYLTSLHWILDHMIGTNTHTLLDGKHERETESDRENKRCMTMDMDIHHDCITILK